MFHNDSKYDYHFLIKQLAKKFKDQFQCLRENMKNILLFQYQSKKYLIIVKQLRKN